MNRASNELTRDGGASKRVWPPLALNFIMADKQAPAPSLGVFYLAHGQAGSSAR